MYTLLVVDLSKPGKSILENWDRPSSPLFQARYFLERSGLSFFLTSYITNYMRKSIYLDYAATTPVDPRVLKAMLPYFGDVGYVRNIGDVGNKDLNSNKRSDRTIRTEQSAIPNWGNPGSLHSFGQKASAAVFNARQTIAKSIGAHYSEIIFTGSATEANNLAIRGAVRYFQKKFPGIKPRVLVPATEHDCVLETVKDVAEYGAEIVYIPVLKNGAIDLKALKKLLNDRTVLVSIMYANNEIGTIQPISEIAEIIRQFRVRNVRHVGDVGNVKSNSNNPPAGGDRTYLTVPTTGAYPLLHTDAVQAFEYLKCDVNTLGVDMLTLSGHKIYGPKGIGCLYVRSVGNVKSNSNNPPAGGDRTSRTFLTPIIVGGGQEDGLRSGTENVPAIVGFAKAVELVGGGREKEAARVSALRDYLWRGVKKMFPRVILNGPSLAGTTRLSNHLNIYLHPSAGSGRGGTTAEEILTTLDLQGIAISSGSACSARSPEPSKVLLALGATQDRAKNSVRITLGRPTTKKDIDVLLAALGK